MAAITEDYISFETAKLLKEKGFDWNCESKKFYPEPYYDQESPDGVYSPTLQMAMKWLREVHNFFIQIVVDFSDGAYPMYDVYVVDLARGTSIIVNGYDRYSYKQASEAAIKYCLKNLI